MVWGDYKSSHNELLEKELGAWNVGAHNWEGHSWIDQAC